MRATINIGDIVIEIEGTLTEVLCGLEHFNGDSKTIPQIKNRKECISELYNNMMKHRRFDFFGREVHVVSRVTTVNDSGEAKEYYFSDGSELKLKC